MKTFSILIFLFLTLPSIGQRKHYTMSLPSIQCTKTTEDGEDEIYLLVIWKTSYGTQGSIRIPKTNEHLSMNDGDNSNNRISFGDILGFDLAVNEKIDIFCSIMEQDDGTQRQYTQVGKEMLKILTTTSRFSDIQAETYKNILTGVANTNRLSNSDDWIGAFTDKITMYKLDAWNEEKTKMNNSNNSGATPNAAINNKYGTTYEFTGDGSHYAVTFQVK